MDIRTIEKNQYKECGLENLLEIAKPPEQLWLSGSLPDPSIRKLAVVGSRALTRYGREACEYLINGLRGYPISIVSGLALGADACAHRAALNAGLHTIAIPGSGLDARVIGPRTNYGLAVSIVEANGALLSEHEPEHAARPEDFPSRNRIMVGISEAVLIIEAGEHSGTLITMRMAADYNRELLCVPHRIQDIHGHGSHTFLRLGATLVSEPSHILEALRLEVSNKSPDTSALGLSLNEQIIYEIVTTPCSRDAVLRTSTLPANETLAALLSLELKQMIVESFGLWQQKK